MRRILNTTTNTIHKPSDAAIAQRTRCGSLRHVPPARTRVISVDEAGATAEVGAKEGVGAKAEVGATAEVGVTRCGRCFEDAGGY